MKTKMLVLIAPIIMLMTSMSYAQTINYSPKLVLNMVPNGNGTYTAATGGTGSQTVISMPQPILLMCSGPSAGQYSACPSGGGGTGTINPGTINVVPAYTGTGTTIGPTGCTIASSIETCLGFIAAGGTNNGNLSLTAVGVVPGTTANSITLTTPNSVTAYVLELPAAAPTSGNTFLSCTAAAPSVCSFAAGGGVSSSTLTANTIPKATGASAIGNSLLTDNATTLAYTGTGGFLVPGVATNATGTAFYGAAASGVTLTPNSYTNVDVAFTRTAAGTWSCDTTTQSNGICTLIVGQIQNSLMQSSTNATVASATTIAPTTPLVTISGTTAIVTITLPSGFTTGCFDILATGAWTTTTAGNIQAIMTAVPNTEYRACYFGSKWNIK